MPKLKSRYSYRPHKGSFAGLVDVYYRETGEHVGMLNPVYRGGYAVRDTDGVRLGDIVYTSRETAAGVLRIRVREAAFQAALKPLLASQTRQCAVINGLHVTTYGDGVVNVNRRDGDLDRADVDMFRTAFKALGYQELESWLPRQGVSLMSDGVSAGVSFRIGVES